MLPHNSQAFKTSLAPTSTLGLVDVSSNKRFQISLLSFCVVVRSGQLTVFEPGTHAMDAGRLDPHPPRCRATRPAAGFRTSPPLSPVWPLAFRSPHCPRIREPASLSGRVFTLDEDLLSKTMSSSGHSYQSRKRSSTVDQTPFRLSTPSGMGLRSPVDG